MASLTRSSSLPLDHALGLLALTRCEGIGAQRALRYALSEFNPQGLITAGLSPRLGAPLSAGEARRWRELRESAELSSAMEWAWLEQRRHAEVGARVISFLSPHYPPLLRLIPRPPPTLFVIGDLDPVVSLNSSVELSVAVIGTRKPSAVGVTRAREVTSLIAMMNGAVISGLALGIDGVAHRAALAHETYTLAVLGHGLDRRYPPEHRALADEVLDRGGALISEQPWSTPPQARCLVARDRLQSALAPGTLIVETSSRGGALHAARAALAQERHVALPLDHRARLQDVGVIRDLMRSSQLTWVESALDLQGLLQRLQRDYRALQQRAMLLKSSLEGSIAEPTTSGSSPLQPSLFDQ